MYKRHKCPEIWLAQFELIHAFWVVAILPADVAIVTICRLLITALSGKASWVTIYCPHTNSMNYSWWQEDTYTKEIWIVKNIMKIIGIHSIWKWKIQVCSVCLVLHSKQFQSKMCHSNHKSIDTSPFTSVGTIHCFWLRGPLLIRDTESHVQIQ